MLVISTQRLKLHLKQPVVHVAQRDQFFVGALLHKLPLMKHDNAIGVSHGVQPVGDQKRRSS